MSTSSVVLAAQLQQLKKQQEELEKRIQEEAEIKKQLNNEASIERLEALVEPITETLDFVQVHSSLNNRSKREMGTKGYDLSWDEYHQKMQIYPNRDHFPPRKGNDLEREEIFVTIIGILKKQAKKIKDLEDIINNI